MASNGNNYMKGGAMSSSGNSPSFGGNLGKNQLPAKEPTPLSSDKSAEQGSSAQERESELPQDVSDLKNIDSKATPAEKEAAKKVATTAATAVGVPEPVAKKVVDELDKRGKLDKIIEEVKKKVKKKILPIILPGLFSFLQVLIPVALFLGIIGDIVDVLDDIKNAVLSFGDVVANVLSGEYVGYRKWQANLPTPDYLVKFGTDQNKEETIKTLKKIGNVCSPGSTVASLIDQLEDNQKYKECSDTISLDSSKSQEYEFLENNFQNYVALKNNAVESYISVLAAASAPAIAEVTFSDELISNGSFFEKAWDKVFVSTAGQIYEELRVHSCEFALAGFVKINSDGTKSYAYSDKLNNISSDITPDKLYKIYDDNKPDCKTWSDKIGEFFLGNISEASGLTDSMSDNLAEKISKEGYTFDSDAYMQYLEYYYIPMRKKHSKYAVELDDYSLTFDTIVDEYTSEEKLNLSKYFNGDKSYNFFDVIGKYIVTGSGDNEENITENFNSVYVDTPCTVINEYIPEEHEFIEVFGINNSKIHSITNGEVVYVNSKGINLYDKWDSNEQKCICSNEKCDNYDGSQIKIKFILDDIQYIAIYSHLSEIYVSVGDKVKAGDLIALEGDTGCTNSKKLKFQIISENGISYNTEELFSRCTNTSSSLENCNFKNIRVDLYDSNETIVRSESLNDYIINIITKKYKNVENLELIKALAIVETSKILNENGYSNGINRLKAKNYELSTSNINISSAVNEVFGGVLEYKNRIVSPKISFTCVRKKQDSNYNQVYNELCINAVDQMQYEEILNTYYPNYVFRKNYCLSEIKDTNEYKIDNEKGFLDINQPIEIEKINKTIENKVSFAGIGSRAGSVEVARYITLGLNYKIKYSNGKKSFIKGFDLNWYFDGIDSSGFVSWILLNGGAKIEKSLNPKEIIANNTGMVKVNSNLYKYLDKIQVGDFAYKDSKIGIIIGKNDGIIYVAECDMEKGTIVTTINSVGESESGYTNIYLADNYYETTGNIISMW